MVSQSNQVKFEQRVRERHFWFRLGEYFLVIGTITFVILMITSYLLLSYSMLKKLRTVSLYLVLLGAIFAFIFSRIGWSKFSLVDLLLNRLSMVFIVGGTTLEVGNVLFEGSLYPHDISYGYGTSIVGVILWLLGLYFHSSIIERSN